MAKNTVMGLRIILLACLLGFFFCFGAISGKAQVAGSDVDISANPSNPGPNTTVTVTLNSVSLDLNHAEITWKHGDQELSRGIGNRIFQFKTGKVGTSTTITASISSDNGNFDKSITVIPSDLVLIWEATDSYTPPFYRGKAMPGEESLIKIAAFPTLRNGNGISRNPKDFEYDWTRNDNPLQSDSGFGKSSLSFTMNYLQTSENINLVVSSADNKFKTDETLNLASSEPQIVFYEKSPLEGIKFNEALPDHIVMNQDEMSLDAEPYFFSVRNNNSLDSGLGYHWQVENTDADTGKAKNVLTLRRGEKGGESTINLDMDSTFRVLQDAANKIRVLF